MCRFRPESVYSKPRSANNPPSILRSFRIPRKDALQRHVNLLPHHATTELPQFYTAALALFPLVCHAAGQGSIASEYGATATKIINAALTDDAGYARLETLCDRIGNRLSGSENLLKAVKWSAEEMQKAGLTNVVTPPVMVPHWVRGKESGEILAPIERPLHFLGLGMSVGTPPQGITADAVVVADFAELASLGAKAAGKIVVFNAPYQGYGRTVEYRVLGASRAAKLGAVGVLVRSITPLAMQIPHTGTLQYYRRRAENSGGGHQH